MSKILILKNWHIEFEINKARGIGIWLCEGSGLVVDLLFFGISIGVYRG